MRPTLDPTPPPAAERTRTEAWLETVRQQVAGLRYGVVQIVIHDARVVQIERTEKIRFEHQAHATE
ncbi:MAG: YezD family protein [Verrucomicrobiota bacterium]|jgi:hypothetical protein